MEEKVQVEVMPDADTSPQSKEETVLEQAVEKQFLLYFADLCQRLA